MVCAVVLVLGAAVTVPTVWSGNSARSSAGADGEIAIAAVDHPIGTLPAAITRGTHHIPGPAVGSRVATADGRPVYLVTDARSDVDLVLDQSGEDYWSGATRADVAAGRLSVVNGAETFVVVPDGYTAVTADGRVAKVTTNLAVLPFATDGGFVLSGAGVPTVTVPVTPTVSPPVPSTEASAAPPNGPATAALLSPSELPTTGDLGGRWVTSPSIPAFVFGCQRTGALSSRSR